MIITKFKLGGWNEDAASSTKSARMARRWAGTVFLGFSRMDENAIRKGLKELASVWKTI